ncbi:MAG: RES family NAD+ phosphorylase [Gemmataceae bacterium]
MPVVPGLAITLAAGTPFFRITDVSFRTAKTSHDKKVVNGQGARKSRHGARYSHPGVTTVYLAETLEVCFAERMFYFHREALTAMDRFHLTGVLPPFIQTFVLWEIVFTTAIPDVFELSPANAAAMQVFPSLLVNPSQDYNHLKDGRAAIEHNGYSGLRAPSSRVKGGGNIVVLFNDHSGNVQSITPYTVEFRLVTASPPALPFTNHATEVLEFTAGEVKLTGTPLGIATYANWHRIEFHH